MATGTRFPDQLADPLPVADSAANTTLDDILTALGTRAAQENGGHIAAIDANTTGAAKESGGHLASADTRLGTIATAVGGAARESGGNLDAIAASVALGAHESGGHLEAVDTNTAAIEGHAASLDTKASQVLTRLSDGTQTTQISGTPTVNIGTAPNLTVGSSALPTGAAKDSTLTDGTQRTQISGTPTVNIGTAPNLTVGSSALPTGAATEATLLAVKNAVLAQIALSDLIVEDSAGNLFVRRETVTDAGVVTITFTDLAGNPAVPVPPLTLANTDTKRHVEDYLYDAVNAGTGYSIGDVIARIVVIDDTTATDLVINSAWMNLTAGTVLTTPPTISDLVQQNKDIIVTASALPTGAAKETGGNLATIAAGVGTKTNASVMPAGGVGQIGWLSAIVAAISQGVSVFLPSATTVVGAAALTSASTVNTDIFTNTVGGYLDVSGYRSVSLTITGTGSFTGGALQFGQTNDLAVSGTNNCFLNSGAAIKTADPVSGVIPTTATFLYEGPITAKYFTIRNGVVWTNTGSITVTAVFSTMPYSSSRWTVGNATASNLVTMPGVGTAANSTTAFRSISVVATGVSVKSSVGRLYQLQITNLKNATIFFKLYNKASAATVGTDTPFQTFAVPAGQTLTLDWMYGLPFSLGLSYAATTLPGDADATAPAANEVLINGQYA